MARQTVDFALMAAEASTAGVRPAVDSACPVVLAFLAAQTLLVGLPFAAAVAASGIDARVQLQSQSALYR